MNDDTFWVKLGKPIPFSDDMILIQNGEFMTVGKAKKIMREHEKKVRSHNTDNGSKN